MDAVVVEQAEHRDVTEDARDDLDNAVEDGAGIADGLVRAPRTAPRVRASDARRAAWA